MIIPKPAVKKRAAARMEKGYLGSRRQSRALEMWGARLCTQRVMLLDLPQNVLLTGFVGWFCMLDGERWCSIDARGWRVGNGMEWMVSVAVTHRGERRMVEPWLEGTERVAYCSQ